MPHKTGGRPRGEGVTGGERRARGRASGRQHTCAGVLLCAGNGALWGRSTRLKPQNIAYISFLYRFPALLSPRVDSPQPLASPTKTHKSSRNGHYLPVCRARNRQARSLNATTMGHPPGHADSAGWPGCRHHRQRVRRHHGVQTRWPDPAGRVGPGRPERPRRHPPPGGKHELVRIRRHHRHVHQRLGELDRTDRHLQRERQVLLLLGGAGRLQQQFGRADRQRGRLLGEQCAVLRLV